MCQARFLLPFHVICSDRFRTKGGALFFFNFHFFTTSRRITWALAVVTSFVFCLERILLIFPFVPSTFLNLTPSSSTSCKIDLFYRGELLKAWNRFKRDLRNIEIDTQPERTIKPLKNYSRPLRASHAFTSNSPNSIVRKKSNLNNPFVHHHIRFEP